MNTSRVEAMNESTPDDHHRVDRAIADDAYVAKAAKRWYKAFRSIAYQTPLPMVVSNPKWGELPTWYRDVLIAAMREYLVNSPDAHKE